MISRPEASRYWTAVFTDLEPLAADASRKMRFCYWLMRRFTRPGYRHVFLMRPIATAPAPAGHLGCCAWLVVNTSAFRSDIVLTHEDSGGMTLLGAIGCRDYGQFVAAMVASGRAHTAVVRERKPTDFVPRPLFSCVEVAKHVLGLETGWRVWTPWQLYRWLKEQTA